MGESPVELPESWPTAVVDAFWSAVNAPTYDESAVNTLRFAEELAKMVRNDRTIYAFPESENELFANLIFPQEEG